MNNNYHSNKPPSLIDQRNELLDAIKRPARKKKTPSNFGLWAALVFSNLVFFILDVISGITVYWMTNFPLYGLLTFVAGFAPFVLHEILYTRAYASPDQKRISIVGAIIALVSIVFVGLAAGVANVFGLVVDTKVMEVIIILGLILIAFTHALLSIAYFYIDEGIMAKQVTEQAIANAMMQKTLLGAGAEVLELTSQRVQARNRVAGQYDPAALAEILKQMGIDPTDEDGDGVPDIFQGLGSKQRQYAAEEKPVRLVPPSQNQQQEQRSMRSDPPNA